MSRNSSKNSGIPTLYVVSKSRKAEKSLAGVHSMNYKLGALLKKEVQCLNREEKNTACSITIDQRIITTRFRNKLSQSVQLMKYHNKLQSRFHDTEIYTYPREMKKAYSEESMCLQQSEDGIDNKDSALGFDSAFSMRKFTDLVASSGRPRTAVEVKSSLWNKRAETAMDRVVRAKSAPPHSWSNCEDIMSRLNCGGGGFYATKNKKRPLSRAKFHEVFDAQGFNEFREMELEKQARDVKSFIQSVKALKLMPWYPGPAKKKDNAEFIVEEMTKWPKHSNFVTRTDNLVRV